jgi:hypothetical protein
VEIVEAVRPLVRIAGDDLIAGLFNRNRLMQGRSVDDKDIFGAAYP